MADRARLLSAVVAASVFPVHASEVHSLDVTRSDDRFVLVADASLNARPEPVFQVLTDYDGLVRLSSKTIESRRIDRTEEGNPVVYTVNAGCWLVFCATVKRTEVYVESPYEHLVATVDPERSSVKYGRQEWALQPEGDGTRLQYTLELEPEFWVPPAIGTFVFKNYMKRGGQRVLDRIEAIAYEVDAP